MDGRLDQLLFALFKESGGLEQALDAVLGFLYRRTDFYQEAMPGDNKGFFPGESEKMLLKIFKKQQNEHFKKQPPMKVKRLTQEEAKALKEQEGVEVKTIQNSSNEIITKTLNNQVKYCDDHLPEDAMKDNLKKVPNTTTESEDFGAPKDEPNIDDKQKEISTFNGATNDKYSWSQDVRNLTVSIKLDRVCRGKDLIVNWDPKHLEIKQAKDNHIILKGEFQQNIRHEESVWQVEDKTKLLLFLEKGEERIWSTILVGDQEIDTKNVENKKEVSELDGETQACVRKLWHDESQKRQGKMTSEQEKQAETLKKAWNSENSPWKGTPYDPDVVKNMNISN